MSIITVGFEESFDDWRVKTNLISSNAGDLGLLNTTVKTSIINAVNELNTRSTDIGTLASLNTSYTSDLVGAINEVNTNADQNTTDTATNTSSIGTINSKITARIPFVHDSIKSLANAGSGQVLDTETYDSFYFTVNFSPLVITELNMAVGRKVNLVLVNGTSATITWPVGTIWNAGTPGVLTSGIDVVELFKIDTGVILATLIGTNYS